MRLISHAVASLFTATPAPRPKATELFDDIAVAGRGLEANRASRDAELAKAGILPEEYYGAIPAATRNRRFSLASLAGLASLDQGQAVHDSLIHYLATGGTQAEWMKEVKDGKISLDLPAHRLDNIFRTNIQSAYNAGRARLACNNHGMDYLDTLDAAALGGQLMPAPRKADTRSPPCGDQ